MYVGKEAHDAGYQEIQDKQNILMQILNVEDLW